MGDGILRSVVVFCALGLCACTDPALVGVADDVRNPLATAGAPAMETGGTDGDDDPEADDDPSDGGLAPECIEDVDCAAGYSCEDGLCEMESSDASCVGDGDCAAGLSCENGACIVETEDD